MGVETGEQFERVLVECLEAAAAGREDECPRLLADHPEYAAELAATLEDRRRLEACVAPLRQAIRQPDETVTFTPGQPDAEMPIPAAFGDYELLEELGRGGMGV